MLTFDLQPYSGIGSVSFGMRPEQVAATAGVPTSAHVNRRQESEEYREGLKITYSRDTEGVVEIVLMRPSVALYRGTDLLTVPNPVAILVRHDSEPREVVGVVVFLGLGLALTGPDDRSVALFASGRWDHLKAQLRPISQVEWPGP